MSHFGVEIGVEIRLKTLLQTQLPDYLEGQAVLSEERNYLKALIGRNMFKDSGISKVYMHVTRLVTSLP